MIGALVACVSLALTSSLVAQGSIAGTKAITNVTATTPIRVTVTGHNVPPGRVLHGVVSGVNGIPAANGVYECTVVDANTFSLASYTNQGISVPSVGVGAYVSGGAIQYAFPDYQILLGRRAMSYASNAASPRIVFVPTDGREWGFESYGGGFATIGTTLPMQQGGAEAQSRTLTPQKATEYTTFEVYVTGCANPPSPDFGDFDATQALAHALVSLLIDDSGAPRARVLRAGWPSQLDPKNPRASGVLAQRGQQWMGVIELQQPVYDQPLQFVPVGTTLTFDVGTVVGGSSDDTIIVVT